jgi:hypothetical protein
MMKATRGPDKDVCTSTLIKCSCCHGVAPAREMSVSLLRSGVRKTMTPRKVAVTDALEAPARDANPQAPAPSWLTRSGVGARGPPLSKDWIGLGPPS